MAPQRRGNWRDINPYPYVKAGLYQALKLRRSLQQGTPAKKKVAMRSRGSRGPSVVTKYRDERQQFKSKRTSKKKRRLVQFAKRIKKANNLSLPLHSLGEWNNTQIYATAVVVGPNSQYPVNTNASTLKTDLRMFGNNANGVALWMTRMNAQTIDSGATLARPATNYDNWDLTANVVMQLALANISGSAILVDVYECLCVADAVTGVYSTAYGAWVQCLANMSAFTSTTTSYPKLVIDNTGTTPFEAAEFRSHWKILNKTRLEMDNGALASLQFKYGPKRINYAKWTDKAAIKGITKDFIIIACPSYGSDLSVGNVLAIEWSKHYHLRMATGGGVGIEESFNFAQSY